MIEAELLPVDLPELGVLERDAAIVEGEPWELISAAGNDRIGFLHRLLTGKIEGVAAGQGGRTMLLTTKGHPVADLMFFVRDQEVRLLVPAGQGEATVAALARYAVMDDFSARLLSEMRPLGVHGLRAAERLREVGVAVPPELAEGSPFAHAELAAPEGPLWAVRLRASGADGLWVFGADQGLQALRGRLTAAGLPVVGPERAEVLRILAGEPRFGAEITADYFPMEVGRTGAIDYGKGCFLGQEPIVRIRDRGHVNWRLVGLRFAASGVVAPGDRLESDVKPKAGRLTSVAFLPDGRPVALGLVHVSVPAGSEVRVRQGADLAARATVVTVPEP
jgi:tRNA-modifying protein YgfZ